MVCSSDFPASVLKLKAAPLSASSDKAARAVQPAKAKIEMKNKANASNAAAVGTDCVACAIFAADTAFENFMLTIILHPCVFSIKQILCRNRYANSRRKTQA